MLPQDSQTHLQPERICVLLIVVIVVAASPAAMVGTASGTAAGVESRAAVSAGPHYADGDTDETTEPSTDHGSKAVTTDDPQDHSAVGNLPARTAGSEDDSVDIVTETDGGVTLRAQSPGLSVFALGSSDDAVRVENASISDTRAFQGDTVTIAADVVNDGPTDRETTVEFVVGNETTTQSVSLPPNSTQRVTHTVTVPRGDGSPELEVYVNGTYVGLIDVVEQASTLDEETATPTPQADTTASPTLRSTTHRTPLAGGSTPTTLSTSTPGFGPMVAVAAFVAVALLARRRYGR